MRIVLAAMVAMGATLSSAGNVAVRDDQHSA